MHVFGWSISVGSVRDFAEPCLAPNPIRGLKEVRRPYNSASNSETSSPAWARRL
jgi:hypothetical protein